MTAATNFRFAVCAIMRECTSEFKKMHEGHEYDDHNFIFETHKGAQSIALDELLPEICSKKAKKNIFRAQNPNFEIRNLKFGFSEVSEIFFFSFEVSPLGSKLRAIDSSQHADSNDIRG